MDLISIFGSGFGLLAIFLALFFLFQKRFQNDGYLYLYGCLIVLGLELLYKVLILSGTMLDVPWIYLPGRLHNLLVYPLLLLFFSSITYPNPRYKHWYLLLLYGFGLYALYVFIYAVTIPSQEKIQMLELFYQDKRPGPYNYWRNPISLLKSTLIPLAFLSVIGIQFYRFQKGTSDRPSLRLLNLLSLIIIVYFLFNQFSNPTYSIVHNLSGYSMVEWPVDIGFLSFLILLISILALMVNTGSTLFPSAKYSGSALPVSAYGAIVDKAKRKIEDELLYKKQSLGLTELSALIGTNPKYLSQSINAKLDCSFVDFVNGYRVEEAKRLMLDTANRSFTLEAIGNLAGFTSKSGFFRAFKKATGMTPNQFLTSQTGSNS
ncbi:helix-turn-helix domain-containing protein [Allomuricauda sp. ARW1Y1]|jgi:AraC-like DNA-binding protein|uniref:helix-turn-helix domain-containing protein n=1 Tax=Allomuricauda sp. ARW1Y1 TaxID=2663843 RepID=UPI0015C99105|nr:helix-turn-helix domain-containing protein [Muricauda sp. ARW1Y1]NYJ28628.1 AraC-like DNA-binding protein [Muricauda sp. ARW1Y1]